MPCSVAYDRKLTPGEGFRAVVINSGNANACTGERGLRDAVEMVRLGAVICVPSPEQALVLSTAIVGEFMPMEKISAGITACAKQLASDDAALIAALRGTMTTDTVHKLYCQSAIIGEKTYQITGMCKSEVHYSAKHGYHVGPGANRSQSPRPIYKKCSAKSPKKRSIASASTDT